MNNIYKKYKERLVEISGKNRSLFSKKIGKQYAYDIAKLIKDNEEKVSLFMDFLLKGNRTGFTLIDKDTRASLYDILNLSQKLERKFQDKTNMSVEDLRKENLRRERLKRDELKKAHLSQVGHLRTLKREVDEFAKETGRYEMFVGYPFVQGELNKDTMIKAPLMLFPMEIVIRDEFTVDLEFKKDEPIMLNKVFILAYAKENRLIVDDLIQEFDKDNKFNFSHVAEVVEYLNKFGFKLKYSESSKLEDFEAGGEPHRADKLTIRNYAVIGRFPLANSIYNDYQVLEKERLSTPAIDLLLASVDPAKTKAKNVATETFPIVENDTSQAKALDEINKFGNVVIFGPPGTGKSQSIVNIISDSIAKGKNILVVSQKKVAMDVVYNRLNTLSNKTMYITDVEKSLTMFYDKVKRVHNEVLHSKPSEAIVKQKKLSQDIEEEVKHLDELSKAVFSPLSNYGESLQTLYATSTQVKKGTFEFKIYNALTQNNEIMSYDYHTLKDTLAKIYDKKKDKLYYRYFDLKSRNPFVPYIKMDINLDDLNTLKVYTQKLIDRDLTPFDYDNSASLKPLLTICLNDPDISEKDILKVINVITKSENPKASRSELKARQKELRTMLDKLISSAKKFVAEEKILKKALNREGYSLIIDNILSGSKNSIKLLNSALYSHSTIKDMMLSLNTLTEKEKKLLEFEFSISKSEDDMRAVTEKLLSIRNYHEIVKTEEKEDKKLSFILDYENTKQRIINLKAELLELNKEIAYDAFNDKYKEFFNTRKDNKDYLYVINKQENMWNIRKTMSYFAEYLLKLFPCFMMSPENVSSIIPLKKDLFDVIIFDEASQIFIENSIPTIYRGKCVAIAGDRKQLKPTTTFMKRYMGNENFGDLPLSEQAALEVESLLDLATSRYANANLTYHYRSRYEELINFSNYAFYDEKLQIAPNTSKNVKKPIERIKVNGIWQDRRNHEEAVEVVKTIKKILNTRKNNETIGVITFNTEQEHYIADIIDVECQKDPSFREQYLKEANRKENGEDCGLFIKNIENVQGEERDIIIFSIGYAKNERGKVVALFGPLSMEGGENRLNVAITRAKEKIYLITSIEPEDLNVTFSKNIGPKILKKYLQYARAVSFGNKYEQKIILESLRKKTVIEEPTNMGLEMEIKEALEKKKYIVDCNLGSSKYKINLAIYNKKLDRYVLGIEIDSNAYAHSENLLERDVFRTKFLNSRGWNIMRLWSRDWWTDKAKTLDLIEKRITKATNSILKEKSLKPKTAKKSTSKADNKALSSNVFDKAQKESKIISTRLNKKVLARLEEDSLNADKKELEIKILNETPDYNLVLEPVLTAKEMREEKMKEKESKKVTKSQSKSSTSPREIKTKTSDKNTSSVEKTTKPTAKKETDTKTPSVSNNTPKKSSKKLEYSDKEAQIKALTSSISRLASKTKGNEQITFIDEK